MSTDNQLDAHIQKNEYLINELAIRIEALNRDVNELLTELKVSSEQLTSFVKNKDHFTEENWKQLIDMKKSLDEKLMKELLNISNPKNRKTSRDSLNIQPHWLYVK